MIKKSSCLLLLAIVFIAASCTSYKKMVYFNDLENVKQATLLSSPQDNTEHKIVPNDVISIHITSPTTERAAYEMFNSVNDYRIGNSTGYLINNDGNIEIPLLSPIKALGLTKAQLKEAILKEISDKRLLLDPIVDIRLLNYEITILGEVAKPNTISVPSEKISLLKALGMAGDITAFGNKETVMVIRESEGKKSVTRVNLRSSNFLQSPFYYLQPNDVVYVETTSNKAASVDKTRLIFPSIVSALSIGIAIWGITRR